MLSEELKFLPPLIDTHAHLADPTFSGAKDIIAGMKDNGLERIIAASYSLENSRQSLLIAQNNENIYCTVGVHPSEVDDSYPSYASELISLAKDEKVVAIGEIGLDYHYEGTDREKQKRALIAMLPAISESKLPVVFHIRDCYEDILDIIKSNLSLMPSRGVLHCFSGSKETAKAYLDMGFNISFAGAVTFKNAARLQEVAAFVPIERMLVETDCPYLTPVPHRGETNYPQFVRYTAEFIAALKGMDKTEFCSIVTKNTYKTFSRLK